MLRGSRRTLSESVDGLIGCASSWARARQAAIGRCTDASVLSLSVIPTRHFQRSLPRLPVPMLGASLSRYASAIKPLVPPSQYDKSVKLIKEFEMREGSLLQDELVRTDRANQHTSFISSDWFEGTLKRREPVPIRQSRTLLVRSAELSAPSSAPAVDMLSRATLWIRSSVLYYKAYLDNTLYPDVRYVPDDAKAYYQQDWFERTIALCPEYVSAPFMSLTSGHHAFPLDMSQHDNLFNSTRAPGVLQDEVHAVGYMPHIIVQYRGRQFAVTVADADSNPLPEDQIFARLRAIVTSPAASSRPRVDVGVFTTLPRTEWNGIRTALLRNARNQKSLETLDSSMFVLNLDDDVHDDFFTTPRETVHRCMAKRGNRWWDKSLSVNVDARGMLSVSYEESWGDGQAVRRYVEDVFQHCMLRCQGGTRVVDSSTSTEPVRELQWSLTPELEQLGERAQRSFQLEADRLDVGVGVLDVFTRDASGSPAKAAADAASSSPASPSGSPLQPPAASATVSPTSATRAADDGLMQLALQLAWWRLNGSPVAAAQPVTMNAFRRGRVDCLFPTTMESQAFVLAVSGAAATAACTPTADIKELCQRALGAYDVMAKEVAAGAGIAAHFVALRNVAQRMHGRIPAFFSDPSYQLLMAPQLVSAPEEAPSLLAATATPVAGGYGVSYTTVKGADPSQLSVVLNVSAWRGADGPRHSATDFTAAVAEAARDIQQLLLS